jgi:hypothetical protein
MKVSDNAILGWDGDGIWRSSRLPGRYPFIKCGSAEVSPPGAPYVLSAELELTRRLRALVRGCEFAILPDSCNFEIAETFNGREDSIQADGA